jgi:hypothetical protein
VSKLSAAGSLVYSTYLGGSGDDQGYGIAVDGAGNAYVTGATASTDFPTAGSPLQPGSRGFHPAFVAKLNPAGSALVYSTFLGGPGGPAGTATNQGNGIAVDSAGDAYVIGTTTATDFPTANAMQPTFGGGASDAFVAKVNPSGSALVYSTFLGGNGPNAGTAIAVDGLGDATVTGQTDANDFPTINAVQANLAFAFDAFVARLNAAGSALLYSTYLGGTRTDQGNAIALDNSGNAYVTGFTQGFFPTAGSPFQPNPTGARDAFVTELPDIGPLTYTAPTGNGADNLILRLHGLNLELLDNSVVVRSRPLANTTSVVLTGANGEPDALTIDNTFGGLIPLAIAFDGGSGGGNALAILCPTTADIFTLTATYATLDTTETIAFNNVQAVTAVGGAGDTAYLFDGPGSNTLTGTPTYVTLSDAGLSLTASGFPTVSSFAGTGSDTAFLFDSAGTDLFIGTPTYSYLQTGTSLNIVSGFPSVRASSSAGSDLALLFDSAGNDVFVGTPAYSYLTGSGFLNLVAGFAQVRGIAGAGGSDAAFLSDSAGNDTFRSTQSYDFLGANDGSYLNLAIGFAQINASAGAGGSDTADLYDTPGNDAFTGGGTTGTLATPNYTVNINHFSTVRATSSAGGLDHLALGALDYAFSSIGPWL